MASLSSWPALQSAVPSEASQKEAQQTRRKSLQVFRSRVLHKVPSVHSAAEWDKPCQAGQENCPSDTLPGLHTAGHSHAISRSTVQALESESCDYAQKVSNNFGEARISEPLNSTKTLLCHAIRMFVQLARHSRSSLQLSSDAICCRQAGRR